MKKLRMIIALILCVSLIPVFAFSDTKVLRWEFVKKFEDLNFIHSRIYSERFLDVSGKDPFSDTLEGAAAAGIIEKSGFFRPYEAIKVEDAVKMVISALLYLKCDLGSGDFITLAKKYGLIDDDTSLSGDLTAEGAARIFSKMTEIYENVPLSVGNEEIDKKINAVRQGLKNCDNETAKNTAKNYFDIAMQKIIQNNSESEVKRAYEEIELAYGAINYNRKSIMTGSYIFDDNGGLIQGHGGNVFYDNITGKYYWYGEARKTSKVPQHLQKYADWGWRIGVACYSSTDLYNWKFESIALEMLEGYEGMKYPQSDIKVGEVIERPKVLYNEKTGKYVMWMHIDNGSYGYSRAGVAVSDSPAGPFKYIESFRPGGKMSRDMTVFKDKDGKAYIYFSTDENGCLAVCKLSDDYLRPEGEAIYCLSWKWREAPAVFRYKDTYYLITSGCTGWDPNEADYATAKSPLGPWTQHGNPCVGEGANKTFGGQGYWVLPVDEEKGHFIFMADIWRPSRHTESSYIWLPIQILSDGSIRIEWVDEWTLEDLGNKVLEPDDLYVYYGDWIKLPKTVKTIIRGEEKDANVLWDSADFRKVGHYEISGKVEGFKNSYVTQNVYIMPEDIVYFVDCGADNNNELEKIKGNLYNSVADQEYKKDGKTNKMWGYVSDNKACGECRIDYEAVSLYLSGFPKLHLSCLLNLKGKNTYMETYRRGILGVKFELKNW